MSKPHHSPISFPGVYIEEVPTPVRTITGVSTSVTAFIGLAKKGPANRPVKITNFAEYERIFGGLIKESHLSCSVKYFFQNGGSCCYIVRVHDDNAKIATFEMDDKNSNNNNNECNLKLQASSAGAWGANLDITISHDLDKDIKNSNREREEGNDTNDDNNDNATTFSLIVKDRETGSCEVFYNVSTKKNNKRFIANLVNKMSKLIRVSGYVDGGRKPKEGHFKLIEGSASDGSYYLQDSIIIGKLGNGNAVDADGFSGTGIYSLDDIMDTFNVMCIPPYNKENTTSNAVYRKALEYCESKHAILLIDPPYEWTKNNDNTATKKIPSRKELDKRLENLRYPNATMYFPHIRAQDPLSGGDTHSFVPSGAVAGVIARTDSKKGVWKPPAGVDANIIGVSELELELTDEESGHLNELGINCLRTIPSAGIVVWGSRTLAKKGEENDGPISLWKYLPVRRTALYIEASIYRGTQWVVFEPNDERLWSQIRLHACGFMHELFRQGAFQGNTPDKAYFVKCDRETTTQDDINKGILNIVVGFAPLKPAEFVVLNIQQTEVGRLHSICNNSNGKNMKQEK